MGLTVPSCPTIVILSQTFLLYTGSDTLQMNSITLPYCWICKSPNSLHEHHIIPRAYGGSDGPTVTLCATCHNGIHHVADGRSEMQPLYWSSKDGTIERAYKLVSAICTARTVASKSDNKKSLTTLELSAEETKKLDKLKVILGTTSRASTLKALINLYG